MVEKQTVSDVQMGILFFVFMTGSSVINIPGVLIGLASNGAWLSLLLSGSMGFGILAMLLFLNRRFPSLSYVDYSRKLVGNPITIILGLLTLTYLFHMLSAIVVDVGLFMVNSMLRETPMYAFTFLIFVIAAVTAQAGIEVIVRMFTLVMLLSTLFICIVFILGMSNYNPSLLLPLLPKGMKGVVHGAYFSFGFPFVETFLFGMLLQFVNKEKSTRLSKTMSISFAASLLLLILSTISAVLVFGPYAEDRPYSLYSVARMIEFQEIIQRIESIIGMSLILGSYMKATITLYVINLFVSRLFRLRESNMLVMLISLVCFFMGLVSYDNASQWGFLVSTIHPIWTTLVLFIPLLLLTVTALFRKSVRG